MDISFSLNPIKPPPFSSKQQTQLRTNLNKDWNAIIKRHANLKNDKAILSTYTQMEYLGVPPDPLTLPLVFKACSRLNAIDRGQRIRQHIEGSSLIKDVRVGTAIVDFYCNCGLVDKAFKVFDEMTHRDLVSWNAMISGFVDCGYYKEAIGLFREMEREGLELNSRTILALIRASEGILVGRLGKEIHGYCLRNGFFDLYPHVGTALIGFYLNFDVRISCQVFYLMGVKSTVSWNAMIAGYSHSGESLKALDLFVQMLVDGFSFDMVTILVVIQACADFGSFKMGVQIHQMAIKFGLAIDLFIVNALLNMYTEIGCLELAFQLFDAISIRDTPLWNSMIAACIEHGCYEEAIALFIRLHKELREDERTIAIMLSLCAELTDGLKMGKSLHAYACKSGIMMDISFGNALLSMYADLNCVHSAQKVFAEITDVDVISYNTLILALACRNLTDEAWELFVRMQESEIKINSHTIISLLAACSNKTCLNIGRSVHGFVVKYSIGMDLSLNTALTDMYMNCGDETAAKYLFEACSNRDLISWNAMIASYCKNNQTNEALVLFNRMISEVEPNSVTIINVLSTCTDLANLSQGQCFHAYATRRFSPLSFNLSLANALITMYTRCGSVRNAEKIFKTLLKRNIISWNAMITGYATHGHANDAILAYIEMLEAGVQPNGITFLSVLSACRHAGLIEKGLQLFHSMVRDYKITPVLSHYGCVVDLLGRGGCLDEAKEFINSMPIEPDASVWRALLSACRDHSNTKLAAAVFEKLTEIEPMNAANYVLLSNIYAAEGLWSEVRQIRTQLKEMGLRKTPGTSWIIIRGQVHYFTAGDTLHAESNELYVNLGSLLALIRESGYTTDVHSALHTEEEE